jgi:hypothetical protein
VRALLVAIGVSGQPENLREVHERESQYARLKLINLAKGKLRTELLADQRGGKALEKMFKRVEKCIWEELRTDTVSLEAKADPPAAYEMVFFDAVASAAVVKSSYLYNRGAEYDWTIQYQAALGGSVSAYFTLFAWGFATDQIKALLTRINTLKTPQS